MGALTDCWPGSYSEAGTEAEVPKTKWLGQVEVVAYERTAEAEDDAMKGDGRISANGVLVGASSVLQAAGEE